MQTDGIGGGTQSFIKKPVDVAALFKALGFIEGELFDDASYLKITKAPVLSVAQERG